MKGFCFECRVCFCGRISDGLQCFGERLDSVCVAGGIAF